MFHWLKTNEVTATHYKKFLYILVVNGLRYSRMNQVKFVEDSLRQTISLQVF